MSKVTTRQTPYGRLVNRILPKKYFGRPSELTPARNLMRKFRSSFHKSNSKIVGLVARLSLVSWARLFRSPPTGFHRSVASVLQPSDPLRSSVDLPEITVAIPFVEKDLGPLPHVIRGAIKTVRNPIREIWLITPNWKPKLGSEGHPTSFFETVNGILSEFPLCRIRTDADLLGAELESLMRDADFRPDGYAIQAVLKFKATLEAPTRATLVVDADTVLLEPKTWFVDEKQLLQFSEEYHQPYRNLISSFFGFEPGFPASFVTHHQLLQKELVRQIFPSDSVIANWYTHARQHKNQKLSEYETYGQFLARFHESRFQLGSWSNLWSPHFVEFSGLLATEDSIEPERIIPGYNSVSFHSHGQVGS